jgi:uncharacterized protein (TIGR02598 family)
MKRVLKGMTAFSLVEVTLALGVAGFCLIAVFGLLPIGVQTNQRALSQTAATAILSSVMADMRPAAQATSASVLSPLFQINIPVSGGSNVTPQTLYFDGAGQFTVAPGTTSRYQLNVTFPPNGGLAYSPTYADLKVTWPATATAANATGSTEMFAAFRRP